MESNTSLISYISGKQTYYYLHYCNVHVQGTTWCSPQLQLLKVVKHNSTFFLLNFLPTIDQMWSQIVLP